MKTKQTILVVLALLVSTIAFSQVGIGTPTPNAKSILELESTTKGFLPPRLTNGERDAITSPASGLTIYNTTVSCLQWWNGSFWHDGCSNRDSGIVDPLPANITLSAVSNYIIASALDSDYLNASGAMPNNTTVAQVPGGAEDAVDASTNDTPIDFQGTLTTVGVTIRIPYTVVTASTSLPAYSQTITIPAAFTQDGVATDVTFSYPAQTDLGVGNGFIEATLNAVGNDLQVIKLDLNSGFGADFLGLLLGKFTYALDSVLGNMADLELRAIPGIPDKNFGDNVHDFIYLPIVSQTGKRWLNNNLGADYANINKAAFNPAQQATARNDHNSFGSMFQWGRVADNHEIVNWTGPTSFTVSAITSAVSSIPIPNTDRYISINVIPYNWYNGTNPQSHLLWRQSKTIYDPCPDGFRVPTPNEFQEEIDSGSWANRDDALNSVLRLPSPGHRSVSNIANIGTVGEYWTNAVAGSNATDLSLTATSVSTAGEGVRQRGISIRCIQE